MEKWILEVLQRTGNRPFYTDLYLSDYFENCLFNESEIVIQTNNSSNTRMKSFRTIINAVNVHLTRILTFVHVN